jgi:hypothetical protein
MLAAPADGQPADPPSCASPRCGLDDCRFRRSGDAGTDLLQLIGRATAGQPDSTDLVNAVLKRLEAEGLIATPPGVDIVSAAEGKDAEDAGE